MDKEHHLPSIRRIEAGFLKGIWKERDNRYMSFLRYTPLEGEAEKAKRKLLVRLALAGVYKERAPMGKSEEYIGRVGAEEKASFIRIVRNDYYLLFQTTVKKAVRFGIRYNTRGRIIEVKCTSLNNATNPSTKLNDYLFMDGVTPKDDQSWKEKSIYLGPLGDFDSFKSAFPQAQEETFHTDIAHAMIERGQRALRTLADTLWNETPFLSQIKKSEHPLEAIAHDYSACHRIGEIVRLWPHMIVEEPRKIKICYEPFAIEKITTSGWARQPTIQ